MATGLAVRFVALLVRFTGKVAQSKTRFRQHALDPIPGGTQVLPSARCFLQACLWRAEFLQPTSRCRASLSRSVRSRCAPRAGPTGCRA